jgi:hypothetical protein
MVIGNPGGPRPSGFFVAPDKMKMELFPGPVAREYPTQPILQISRPGGRSIEIDLSRYTFVVIYTLNALEPMLC